MAPVDAGLVSGVARGTVGRTASAVSDLLRLWKRPDSLGNRMATLPSVSSGVMSGGGSNAEERDGQSARCPVFYIDLLEADKCHRERLTRSQPAASYCILAV